MFIPKHFEITDSAEIFSFLKDHAFGQLVSTVDGRLYSTHLPFLLSEDNTKLIAHLALKNPQYAQIQNQEILVTFQGPHDYISPSWYVDSGVPTWNYQAVHVYGKCKVFSNPERLQDAVNSLTQVYESNSEKPWQPEYKIGMLKAIVGIEIVISDVQCKYKLSQNRSTQDQQQVVQALEKRGATDLAKAMIRQNSV